jgi:hypothetical protein
VLQNFILSKLNADQSAQVYIFLAVSKTNYSNHKKDDQSYLLEFFIWFQRVYPAMIIGTKFASSVLIFLQQSFNSLWPIYCFPLYSKTLKNWIDFKRIQLRLVIARVRINFISDNSGELHAQND